MAEQEQEQKEMGLDLDARKVKRPWIKIEGVKYHIRRQVDMAEGIFPGSTLWSAVCGR